MFFQQYFVPKHSHYEIIALQAPHLLSTSHFFWDDREKREREEEGEKKKEAGWLHKGMDILWWKFINYLKYMNQGLQWKFSVISKTKGTDWLF